MLLTASAPTWPQIVEYFRTPDISLAILPVKGPGDLQRMGVGVLQDVTERLAREPKSKPKFQVIPLVTAQNKGVSSPDQASRLLHATHVLQLELHRDGNGVAVDATVVDLKTKAVRDYPEQFSADDLGDLPGWLAGKITASLHLKHMAAPEAILPAAAAAYSNGLNHLREGRYSFDQAIVQFQKAAQQDPRSPLPFAGLVEAYVAKYGVENDSQALEQATVHLQTAEKRDPDSPSVHMAAAWLHISKNKNAQAMEDCSRALEVDPRNAQAWMLCGFLYDLEGIDDKAQEYFGKAIALDPYYFRPYQFLGGYYNVRGQYAEAEQQYKKEVQYALNDMDGFSDLGSMLAEQGKYDKAIQIFQNALDIKVTPASLNNLGVAMAYLGRDTEALRYYKQAAALESSNYGYWINIGDVQRRLRLPGAAKAAYLKAFSLASAHLQTNPRSYETRAYMAYVEARLGQKGSARKEIVQALQSPDNDKQILLCAILTYEALGDREQALKLVNRALSKLKSSIEHHPDLADLRRDLRYLQMIGKTK